MEGETLIQAKNTSPNDEYQKEHYKGKKHNKHYKKVKMK